jgi:hypothetical protein
MHVMNIISLVNRSHLLFWYFTRYIEERQVEFLNIEKYYDSWSSVEPCFFLQLKKQAGTIQMDVF